MIGATIKVRSCSLPAFLAFMLIFALGQIAGTASAQELRLDPKLVKGPDACGSVVVPEQIGSIQAAPRGRCYENHTALTLHDCFQDDLHLLSSVGHARFARTRWIATLWFANPA